MQTEAPNILVWKGPGTDELSPKYLVPHEQVDLFPERWQFKPFDFTVYPDTASTNQSYPLESRDPIVDTALRKFANRLIASDIGNNQIEMPPEYWNKREWRNVQNPPDTSHLRTILRPGTGQLNLMLNPMEYGAIPDPKPLFFYISAVDQLPEDAEEFDFGRRQLVRASAQNGIIFEVNRETEEISGFLWMSMQGNHQIVRGGEQELLDSAAIRFCVHNGDTFVTGRSDYPADNREPIISWEDWSQNPIHHDLYQMTQDLHKAKYLDDHVEMVNYTPEMPKHGQRIADAINRSSLGEGMYSAKIGKVVAISPSGGGKVDWSPDPNEFHLTPLSHMTETGTVVYIPTGAPSGEYKNGSVEARENLDTYVMRQRFAMGAVDNLADYERWQRDELEKHSMIPVYQEGAPQEDFTIVHLHGMPDQYDSEKVEVVEPDYQLYPQVDMACGTMGGNGSLRSALAKSKWFTTKYEEGKHFLDSRTIVVRLRGHGVVILTKNPQEVIRALKEDMEFSRPAKLMV